MKTIEIEKKNIDVSKYKMRYAEEQDFDILINEDVEIKENGITKIVSIGIKEDLSKLLAAARSIKYETDYRTGGLKTTSRIFGYSPRITFRKDFCTSTSLAIDNPEANTTICASALLVDSYYKKYSPEFYEKHKKMTAKILNKYLIGGSVFTSGIVNKNNQLMYHFDSGNFKQVWSCMIVFKKDVEGGHLSVPEYGLGFELKNNSLFMFDGQGLLHGVTPIIKKSPEAYRYSIVYYTLQQMWKCKTIGEELERIRSIKTQREIKRA